MEIQQSRPELMRACVMVLFGLSGDGLGRLVRPVVVPDGLFVFFGGSVEFRKNSTAVWSFAEHEDGPETCAVTGFLSFSVEFVEFVEQKIEKKDPPLLLSSATPG
ncbi:hypothetical protein ACKVEX_14130, partial [Rhodocyclaceae bacterium SMB388]